MAAPVPPRAALSVITPKEPALLVTPITKLFALNRESFAKTKFPLLLVIEVKPPPGIVEGVIKTFAPLAFVRAAGRTVTCVLAAFEMILPDVTEPILKVLAVLCCVVVTTEPPLAVLIKSAAPPKVAFPAITFEVALK